MKLFLFATCLWHTTLQHRNTIQTVDLVERPAIGKKVHINGHIWKVKDTKRACSTPPQEKK